MASLSKTTINTRDDLDAIIGTAQHQEFMELLRASMTRKQDVAIRPDGYGSTDYTGAEIPPVWEDVEDLSVIQSFGFDKADFV